MKVTKTRSFVKALSYRIWATFFTLIIAYLVTKNATISITIALGEMISKIFIYYFHERVWNYIQWGRKS